ncbi:MAG: AAA family ATPase [Planctomycetes bacterium]|nr:AAA family ATPase [Planctomycetota bacterium]
MTNDIMRIEPSTVMKFVEDLDAFVQCRIFPPEDHARLLQATKVEDRRSYENLVLEQCLVEPLEALTKRFGTKKADAERIRGILYELCTHLNPALDIHKVILPVYTPDAKAQASPAKLKRKRRPKKSGAHELAERLKARVVGQDEAIEAAAAAVARARVGLRDRNRPVGTFLFVGQTGVGKTELAKALADELAGDGRKALVRIDCSEYSLPHEYAKLIGAPPGYVGHEQGGYLCSVMSEADAAVVLFDEIEKAHEKVHNLLLQIMDEGYVTDARGVKIDFTNTLIVLTSNQGTDEVGELENRVGFGSANGRAVAVKERAATVRRSLERNFRPEFLNRIDETIVFKPLDRGTGRRILDKFVAQLSKRAKAQGVALTLTEPAADWILAKGFSDRYGARELRRCVQRELETPLADAMLDGRIERGDGAVVEVGEHALQVSCQRAPDARRTRQPKPVHTPARRPHPGETTIYCNGIESDRMVG